MSRSFESLRLRLTTEGLEAWYRVEFSAPERVSLQTGGIVAVPVTVTNTGRSAWDSRGIVPFRLSYHWLLPDEDSVVSWEGLRTEFPNPIPPGATVTMNAQVEAPPEPGDYRLMWDIEQEDRLWFSTEPDAELWTSDATVRGPASPDARENRSAAAANRRTAWTRRPLGRGGPDAGGASVPRRRARQLPAALRRLRRAPERRSAHPQQQHVPRGARRRRICSAASRSPGCSGARRGCVVRRVRRPSDR